MRVCCISDTHGRHNHFTEQLKAIEADVLIHAGDITGYGTIKELRDFMEWFNGFSHIPNRIFIGGNHDGCLEYTGSLAVKTALAIGTERRLNRQTDSVSQTHYLCNSGIEINGVKFWGSPYSPKFMDWYFMYSPGEAAEALWALIPEDTHVLITHGPPYGILDEVERRGGGHVGCQTLLSRIENGLKCLQYHVFGHIHNGYGGIHPSEHSLSLGFVNAALLNEQYKPTNAPIIFEI